VVDGFRGGRALALGYGEVINHVQATFGAELFTTVIFDSNPRSAPTRPCTGR
jgi:hypothetical protein